MLFSRRGQGPASLLPENIVDCCFPPDVAVDSFLPADITIESAELL